MCSTWDNAALPALGFPIRASAGQRLFSASPRLIAAVHVLHRLLVPRHPPCALTILTVILMGEDLSPHPVIPVSLATVQFSRSAKRLCTARPPRGRSPLSAPAARRSLKTQQHATTLAHAKRRRRPGCQIRSTCLVTECAQSFGREELIESSRGVRLRHSVPSQRRAP